MPSLLPTTKPATPFSKKTQDPALLSLKNNKKKP